MVIAIAPGHEANLNPSGFMHEIVGQLNHLKIALKIPLYRTTAMPKSKQRIKATHEGTISLYPSLPAVLLSADFFRDKVIIFLDDIWTSGSTLCACKDVIKVVYPNNILLCAIGMTTYPPPPPPPPPPPQFIF